MTDYFMAHGIADRAVATAKAVGQLGAVVKRQALIMGFSDTFAVIGVVLSAAALAVLLARKSAAGCGRGPARIEAGNDHRSLKTDVAISLDVGTRGGRIPHDGSVKSRRM